MTYRFFHRARVNAPVDVAWGVFTEHEKFSEWTSLDWKIVKDGSPERNGLGCIRQEQVADAAQAQTEEVINYWVPNQLYGYHVISDTSFDSHQGIVRFFPKGPNSCEWVYDAQYTFSEKFLEKVPDMPQIIQKWATYFMHDAECECERRASDIDVPAFPLPVENTVRSQA